MRKIALALILIVTLIGCEAADPVLMEEGLYFDDFSGFHVRLLVVDEWGEISTEYLEEEFFWLSGFAFHEGIAGKPWVVHEDSDRAYHHLSQATAPVKLHYQEETGIFYIHNQQVTEDWLAVLAELDKYNKEWVFVPNGARPGEIVLTHEDNPDPSFIKKITVLEDPITGERHDELVGVKGKELHLLEPRNHPLGVSAFVKVDLARGEAWVSLILEVFVAGLAPI